MIVGGGSGGHITPTLAVGAELKLRLPGSHIDYILGKNDALTDVVQGHAAVSAVHQIYSGKFRRYHGAGLRQLLDLPTVAKNLRDVVYIIMGTVQSFFLLRRLRPDVMLIKGGFVGVPVGLAAAALGIPYVTHDSDALPGLANRIIARWAVAHAVAMPKDVYGYPANKTIQVGVPISADFQMVNAAAQASYKKSFGLGKDSQVLLVTGGGLGANRLNLTIPKIAKTLLDRHPKLCILHIAGRGKDADLDQAYDQHLKTDQLQRVVVEPFVKDLHRYSGASDVIVTRASATTLAELAAQAKACIVVPNHELTGGHQTKNADVLSKQKAIVSLSDQSLQKNPELLLREVERLLANPKARLELARNLHNTSDQNSAQKLTQLLINVAEGKGLAK